MLFAAPSWATTVEVTVPDGVTEIEVQYTLPVPPVVVPPEPPVVVVPPVVVPPVPSEGLVYPATRPDWCGEVANFCVSLSDSLEHRTTYILMTQYPNEARYDFKLEPGTHAVRMSTPKDRIVPNTNPLERKKMVAPVTIDGYGATQDCLTATIGGADGIRANHGFEGQGCIVSVSPDTTISGLAVISGSGTGPTALTPPGSDRGFRCIRVLGNMTVKDVTLVSCNHGMQGDGSYNWSLDNVTMTDCSNRHGGLSHCIYSSVGPGSLTIINSNLQTYSGHAVKTGSKSTHISNTVLTEGAGDSGFAVHSTSNELVELDTVTIVQGPVPVGPGGQPKGNLSILGAGPKLDRCGGPGEWRFKDVTITDYMAWKYNKFSHVGAKFRCPLPTAIVDLGGNTLTKYDEAGETTGPIDLFKADGSFE